MHPRDWTTFPLDRVTGVPVIAELVGEDAGAEDSEVAEGVPETDPVLEEGEPEADSVADPVAEEATSELDCAAEDEAPGPAGDD